MAIKVKSDSMPGVEGHLQLQLRRQRKENDYKTGSDTISNKAKRNDNNKNQSNNSLI